MMKTRKSACFIFSWTAIWMVFLFGCAGTQSEIGYIPYSDMVFTPTVQVAVFDLKVPEKEYFEVGKLTVEAGENAVLRLIKKAKEIGADAIIIRGTENSGSRFYQTGTATYEEKLNNIIAIAIKYK